METTADTISRRNFLGSAAAASAAFTFVPRHVLGRNGSAAPSDKLNIAGIGVGGMGKGNMAGCEAENIVALCDRVPRQTSLFQFRLFGAALGNRADG